MKSSLKTQILISIITGVFFIVGAIISSPHWFKHFFPDQYVERELIMPEPMKTDPRSNIEIERDTSYTITTGTEIIAIEKLELCPVNSNIPAYFFLEIKNNGTKTLTDLKITIDFGKAKYLELDFLTSKKISSIDTITKNIISFTYKRLEENESLSVYSLLSQPFFKSIKINGPNLKFPKEYLYKNYLNSDITSQGDLYGFYIFLQLLLGGTLIVLAIILLLVLNGILKRKGLLKWEV